MGKPRLDVGLLFFTQSRQIIHALVIFLLLLLAATPAAAQVQLPEIGDPASALLSPAQEQQLGRNLLREVRRNLPISSDPQLLAYIEAIGQRLVSSSQDGHDEFTFLVIDDPRINAFAMPGGIIGMNTGLIIAARNEAEMAAVLAHEIAHVTQRHIARAYAGSTRTDLAAGLAILAGIIASAYSPELGQAAMISGMAGGVQARLNFTRANEQEADRIGISLLAESGFDPEAMPSFFERMMQLAGPTGDSVPEYLRTHPVTANRISDSRARAAQFAHGDYRQDGMEFRLMRMRAEALEQPAEIIQRYARNQLHSEAAVAEYGYAIALIQRGQADDALSVLQALDTRSSESLKLKVDLATAEALLRVSPSRADEATTLMLRLNDIYPGQLPVVQLLAEAQIRQGEYSGAIRNLDRIMNRRPMAPDLLRLKAEAAAKGDLPALSHETMAEYYFHHARFHDSVRQLDRALSMPGLSSLQAERIRSKREIAASFAESNP
ncbi:Putative Zn-dependent protease, contains TPR repeats [Ectothiorhodosinus mongolicus]|uniref:Putative Zn-dependent protease, contains TPR repeats n=1 Tax=Ectothiorhodosinus mongolicus TaxID=233100 RepID=A0A1R3VPH3_9GAMM|nr:M48 family metalloprotease [Ectothiorhodosinus mongolicus]SIT66527.1 Putative Zn-dependent protease, contains TPR repeats [Ectothiorhodosinus mongolicus]